MRGGFSPPGSQSLADLPLKGGGKTKAVRYASRALLHAGATRLEAGMSHPNRDRARFLRSNMTETERFVWQRIRRRQLAGFKFRRQHPLGPFIVDFVCLERKLVLELDGGQHAAQTEYDAQRTSWLAERGYRVFRVWNFEAIEEWDAMAERICELLREVGGEPSSTPRTPNN
jgi:very-short-patch-repair endonuclease